MATATGQWVRCEADEKAVAAGCRFDLAAAERVPSFFRKFLRHSKGQWAGQPFELLPWQWEEVIAPLFGWMRPDGTRRFRSAYVEVGKKNGKSTLMAGLETYMLVADGEPGAEVYSAAADRSQASIIYDEAEKMVRASPNLRQHILLTPSQKHMSFPRTNSILKALSADAYTKEGLNASFIAFDELHAQRTRVLWDALCYAGVARRQPLLLAITTAGWDRNSICWEQRDYACKVRDGIIDDIAFLPVIHAADKEDDWTDPEIWAKANPSLGVTVRAEELAQACKEAQESPAKENSFKRYRLNIWTEQASRWLSMEQWDKCNGEVSEEALRGQPCWAGLDLSSTNDITAFARVFKPLAEGDVFRALLTFWVPGESMIRREQRDRVPYPQWQREGYIERTEGNVVDYSAIRQRIKELHAATPVMEIAFDPFNATHIAQQLADDDGFTMIEFRQGFLSMNEPSKALERLVQSRGLAHGGNPVLRWMASNVAILTDARENIAPSKKHSGEKIDGIVTVIMGLARAQAGAETSKAYDQRWMIWI
ncbi:MAG TPA: terminase TerL endonuclease subunit [Phycisphaerae bacterium]|nr:terminase TerL endonuclease subunit [Phycisphaerae bacterium]